jgi:transcriptional regulator with XRE-family HTH domain
MTTDELLDLVRAKHSLRSEAQLAGALGIPESKLVQYRRKSRPVDVDLAWVIADLLQRSPAEVIAVIFFEAETDPAKRRRWRDRLTAMGVLAVN